MERDSVGKADREIKRADGFFTKGNRMLILNIAYNVACFLIALGLLALAGQRRA